MRVHVVSDVHGSADALKAAGQDADALVCLGDLVLFVDYADVSGGIFGELFGADKAATWVALRTAGRTDEARAYLRSLWEVFGADPWPHVQDAVRRQYAELFAAMPDPTYLTYGNVDLPALWPEFTGPAHTVLDGQIVTLGGRTFGFVGGGLPSVPDAQRGSGGRVRGQGRRGLRRRPGCGNRRGRPVLPHPAGSP